MTQRWQLDHLVVAARSLDEGAAWCEAMLGIVPGPGGKHPLMATHNRLFSIATARHPRAYFEIIAIDPDAPPPGRRRWYDLDDPGLQHALASDGPALIHWVAGCGAIDAEIAALRSHGIDRGDAIAVERATARGPLRWRISVRSDGARLRDGAWPTLIEWDGPHPAETMAPSGVGFEALAIDPAWPSGLRDRLPPDVTPDATPAPLVATLTTPRGRVALHSLRVAR
jgi:hypothetical protein